MSMRFRSSAAAAGFVVICVWAGPSSQAFASFETFRECSGKYQAAKAANELNGQSWREFYKACRSRAAALSESAKVPEPSGATFTPASAAAAAAEDNKAVARAAAPTPPEGSGRLDTAPPEDATAAAGQASVPSPAAREARRKQCEAQWKAQWVRLHRTDPKATWDKYWSACDRRLSAKAQ